MEPSDESASVVRLWSQFVICADADHITILDTASYADGLWGLTPLNCTLNRHGWMRLKALLASGIIDRLMSDAPIQGDSYVQPLIVALLAPHR